MTKDVQESVPVFCYLCRRQVLRAVEIECEERGERHQRIFLSRCG